MANMNIKRNTNTRFIQVNKEKKTKRIHML